MLFVRYNERHDQECLEIPNPLTAVERPTVHHKNKYPAFRWSSWLVTVLVEEITKDGATTDQRVQEIALDEEMYISLDEEVGAMKEEFANIA